MEEVKNTEYGALYQRYARRLYGFFLRQLNHDTQAAADATHEVFLRVLEATSSEKTHVALPYLFTIAYNLLRNRYRRQAYESSYLATLDRQPLETTDVELRLDRQTLLTAFAKCSMNCHPHSAYCSRFVTRKSSRCRKWRRYSKSLKAP